MNRGRLSFRYFFNAGYDPETNETDLEGTDVFQDGHYVGMLRWVVPTDIIDMDDEELEQTLIENNILL